MIRKQTVFVAVWAFALGVAAGVLLAMLGPPAKTDALVESLRKENRLLHELVDLQQQQLDQVHAPPQEPAER